LIFQENEFLIFYQQSYPDVQEILQYLMSGTAKNMKRLITTLELWKEGNMYTSYCPELDIASCGHTPEEARLNLSEVISIQLEETLKLGTLDDFLHDAGYDADKEAYRTRRHMISFEEIQVPIPV